MALGYCADCGSEHLRPGCGLTYRERLRSTQIHNSVLPSREKRKYWDGDALKDQFGDDATEKTRDATEGYFDQQHS